MKFKASLITAAVAVAGTVSSSCYAETIKLAHIDPYSGPAAGLNSKNVAMLKFVVDLANRQSWAGTNNTFEVVGFDNKNSAQETLLQFKHATDQGINYVVQGLSSSVGLALIEAVNRHNERNPGKEVVYMTPVNQATEMTNEKCSFWFFRFDANVDMRSQALTSYLAKNKSIKKIYLINQNYATGQQVSSTVKAELKHKRPDIEIVGDDLHPMFQVKDFSPYVAKIKASGADAIITSNWSGDLTLLVKALKDSSVKTSLYTYNASATGIPTALAAAGIDNVKLITYWVANDDLNDSMNLIKPIKANTGHDFTAIPFFHMVRMLSQAIRDAKSNQPLAVARALENMRINSVNGEIHMRKSDHQLQQSLVIAEWTKTNGSDVKYDLENTGWGFKTVSKFDAYVSSLPTSCQMMRPS
ncbi:MAG: branched-chain amino acid ABC transporter substrate-binding protein [Sulfuricaulis sp.]|nr:branched-chain amino acid ABC transporter substrate-binding protein [Sulfuricaulis sp.]